MATDKDISYPLEKHPTAPTSIPIPEIFKGVANFLGLRTAEEPFYRVQEQDGDKEIRHYPELSMAHMDMQGDYDTAMEVGFHYLADYIFGKNTRQVKMAMTAPVFQQRTTSGWTVSFLLPSKYTAKTAPSPLDERIELEKQNPQQVAVISYSGWTNKKIIYAKTRELIKWLKANGSYQVISKPRAAQYDPPFAIPFLRRNEVHITVTPNTLH